MNNTPGVVSNRKPTGCGLRNIGGIDFTLTGNFVSSLNFTQLYYVPLPLFGIRSRIMKLASVNSLGLLPLLKLPTALAIVEVR